MKYTKEMFIRFGTYFKKHRVLFITDLAVAFCLAAIELAYPIFTTRIIDDLIPNGSMTPSSIRKSTKRTCLHN